MGDFLLAIWADRDTCKPYTGPGRIGHVVRVTSNPHPTIVNEFTDGGSFEHEDCGPASLQSWLLDATPTRTTVRELEILAGTNLNGTGFKGLVIAAQHFGYQATFVTENPEPGTIMNPGGGYIDAASTFPSYLAASQGGCVVLPNLTPAPKPTPPPAPIPQEESTDMYLFNTGTPGIWALYWGKYFHVTPDDLGAFEAIAVKPIQTIGAAGHAVLLATYGVNP